MYKNWIVDLDQLALQYHFYLCCHVNVSAFYNVLG
jgi:hypothetical protein